MELKSHFAALETKLTEHKTENMKQIKASKKTFSEATKENGPYQSIKTMRELLRSEKMEEKLEEQRIRSKELNIIIHGIPEKDTDYDTDFVNELLDDTSIYTEQELYVSRIGQSSKSKQRPIKVIFSDVGKKNQFMRNLNKLKDISKYYKMSITDDLTKTERELIKLWKNKADQRNKVDKNSNYVWRVRGSPRGSRGLYLKKIVDTRQL